MAPRPAAPSVPAAFDPAESRRRCLGYRRRILDLSQRISALHMAPAFSCLEIVDALYYGRMRWSGRTSPDTFVLSKGHGCLAQYAVLESLGILDSADLDRFCTAGGLLGGHPDRGTPGVVTSTGSLGHGLSVAVGIALGERLAKTDGRVYVVLSDGEMQEGSTWEAILMASTLRLGNLIAVLDNNDLKSLGRTSESHPSLYPIAAKLEAFGWDTRDINGHDASAVVAAAASQRPDRPVFVSARTIKGRGVAFMENSAIWHYRSPSPDEYAKAVTGLAEIGR